MMAKTFKVMAALLSYPTADIQGAGPELKAVLAEEGLLSVGQQTRLGHLIDQLESRDLYDLQERYVSLFDRSRTLSLHLFEHVHGESRARGQAMVDLQNVYGEKGLEINAKELPDFLPLFLEFLSTLPLAEASDLLGETSHVLEALRDRLRKRKSIYAAVFRSLLTLATMDAEAAPVEIQTEDEEADDLEALDKAWAEEPVTFGPGEAGCNVAEKMLEKMKLPTAPAVSVRSQGEQR
ncbi:respiratory nitrate reductase chaperone NarJ [Maricaulis salignorans]|uniref:Respiratory nitrate reductase chaperone NarJ n=2 Tax=Maricaulis salignorans TaxID=144026 RepID=A0A1G9LWJ4_9PROT|nr:nitrate reductase molybdenum cofactor assembly chaperone [Maricaulis salignorans]SDL66338.1 respiratory nitrate reductase chaperone NarJ [Maricaulis salignorans]